MNIIKICMDCGNEFGDNIRYNDGLLCPRCGSGDIDQPTELNYDEMTLEDCFIGYHKDKVACVCDADAKSIYFLEE